MSQLFYGTLKQLGNKTEPMMDDIKTKIELVE